MTLILQLCFVRRHGGNVGVGPAGVTLQYVVTVRAIHYLNIWVKLPWRHIMHKIVLFSQSLDNQYSKTVESGGLNLFPLF